MKIFEEYRRLVELYEKDPSHPQTQNELINICYLPEFYSNFGLNTDKQKLALSSKHLYTMQVAKKQGYYKESSDTHYHNLGKDNMLLIPKLLGDPDFVLYDNSSTGKENNNALPSTLVTVFPKVSYSINKESKNYEKRWLVAYIKEPLNPKDKITILATSFNKPEIERYINKLYRENKLLYLNEKVSLSTVYPGLQFPNIATHSNGETRNSMAFLDSLNDNIRQYRENVNIERMKVSGLYLEYIPENEKTKKVCNAAFANNPGSIIYFPENIIKKNKYERDVFESLNAESIQSMPDDLFINSLQYFLQHTDKASHQGKILYRTINKRISDSQRTLLCETIDNEHEPDENEIISKFIDWSEGNLHEKSLPKNIPAQEYHPSEETSPSAPIEVIGKHFETDAEGKFTLESFKEIARTMEIYSDKHYETARYLFVKDGQIMRHIAVSSQTPASTIIKPDDNFLFQLKRYAENTGSKIVFLHNHPSGYVEPSEADIKLTAYMQNFFKESSGEDLFAGHIILDHGTYGLYTAESKNWNAFINDKLEPLSKLAENYKVQLTEYGMKTVSDSKNNISGQSLKQLSEYAKKCDGGNVWNTKNWIPAFVMTGNGVVTSLEYINNLELTNTESLSAKLKSIGRNYGSENIVFFPRHPEQLLACERYAQLSGKVKDIYFEKPDGTYETSQFHNGNIFNDLTKDEIKVQDTNENPELVNQKIMFENIYKENKTMEKRELETVDKGIESVTVNGGASDSSLEKEYMATQSEIEDIDEVQRQMDMDNGLIDKNGNEIVYNGPEEDAKSSAKNFVLNKLEKAGIEVVKDKEQYENMLAYVREVNIALEMLNEEPYPVQEMTENKRGLEQDMQNILPPTSSKPKRIYITDKKSCQDYSEKFEALKEKTKNLSPEDFLNVLKETLGTNSELDSNYARRKIDGITSELRVSNHYAHAFDSRFVDKSDSLVIKFVNNRFKPYKDSILEEFVYNPENLTEEKKIQIIDGIKDYFINGEYTDTHYDDYHKSPKEELQKQLAEQMTLGGFKKSLMTGIALATIATAAPKLYAETKITGISEDKSNVSLETVLDVTELKDGYRAISNHNNKTDWYDMTFIVDKDGNITNVMSYEAFESNIMMEKGKTITTKPIQFNMSSDNLKNMLHDWNYKGLHLASHGGSSGMIDEYNENTYLNLMNGMMAGEFNENLAEFLIKDSLTYGFALNGKVYLDPDLADSNVAAHEYTHIWDKYTEKNNPALWEQGKTVFKKTSLWNEVIKDENYSNIKNDENLVLSECHARIVGKMAEEVLERIALENGGEVKEEVINWDKEVEKFIEKEFGMSDPELTQSEETDYLQKKVNFEQMKSFLLEPMKDLMSGKNISLQKLQENSKSEFFVKDNNATKNIDLSKVIVFDTETTGFKAGEDELLQVSIADGNGNKLFNSYVKPEHMKKWPKAQEINGISPETVKDAPTIKELVPELQKILDRAELFVSYNGRFDVNFLEAAGLTLSENTPHLDVIKSSASVTKFPMNSKTDKRSIDGYHYPKLTDVAQHFNIEFDAHNSMGDTLATLEVAKNIYGQNLENLTPEILSKYTIDEKKEASRTEKIEQKRTFDSNNYLMGYIIRERHPEILDEIKNNPGNEKIKELLSQLEENPKVKGVKTKLNTLLTEYAKENHPEIENEANSYLEEKTLSKSNKDSAVKEEVPTTIPTENIKESSSDEIIKKMQESFQKQMAEMQQRMQEQSQKQTERLQQMLEESENRNRILQNQLDMMKEQFKQAPGVTANESQTISGNSSVPGPIMQEEQKNNEVAKKFNRNTAYIVGTPVPKFGKKETVKDENGEDIETGKIELIKNAKFKRFVQNELDDTKNEIVLSVLEENGTEREIVMKEQDYNNIIVAEQNFYKALDSVSQDSWDWMKAHIDRDKRLLLDQNKYRLNTPEDFFHNFEVHIRKGQASNPKEAMKIAAWMVERMAPNDRKRFVKMRKKDGEEVYDMKLLECFERISKDRKLDSSELNFSFEGPNALFKDFPTDVMELNQGEVIEGTKTKVGDSISMAITTRDLFEKKLLKTPKADFKILRVSKGLYPEDKAVLYNEKTKATYFMPLKDVVKHIQKVELLQNKEKIKEAKKDYKIYGYEGR